VKRIKKELRALKRISKTNPLSVLLRIFIYGRIGRRAVLPVNVLGQDIYIRTTTSDLEVAVSSLGGEYSCLDRAYPKSHMGLIIDAGGYIGTAAIALAEMYPNATVVSIEPAQENFELLKRNTRRHANIVAHNAALLPHSEGGHVDLMNRGTGEWGFTVVENPADRPAQFIQKVEAISLDRLIDLYGCDRITICKMDVEGAEHRLLMRHSWLEKTDILMIELHERIVPGCEQVFEDATKGRFTYSAGGEKLVSVGKNYFLPVPCTAVVEGVPG
jgi:FkbM family methyltransferase